MNNQEDNKVKPSKVSPGFSESDQNSSVEKSGELAGKETIEAPKAVINSPDAGIHSRDRNPNFRWFVVHTYSMFEEKAKQTLLERIRLNKRESFFGQIIVPKMAHEMTLKSGKKKRVEKNAFPGYIIVEMEMNEETNHLVRDTPKITGFVGNARNPRPISDQEVLRLTSPETIKEQVKQQTTTQSFEKGESVKVIDGAFTNFDGIVEAVQADKMKLRILVSIFGRETPVELDYGQVQKLNS